MSTSDTPEIATTFGAYDSAAIDRALPVDAHLVRNVIRNSNRLAAKGEHVLTLAWPLPSPYYNSDGFYRWIPTTHWTRLLPPIPIRYRRGLRTAELRLHARVSMSHTVTLQVGTTAQPFSEGATAALGTNTLDLVGDGDNDVDSYTQAGIVLDPSGSDWLDLRAIATETTDLADDASGGSNERSDIVTALVYNSNYLTTSPVNHWTASPATTSYAHTGTEIAFDTGGGYTLRRLIVLTGQRYLFWGPALSDADLALVQSVDDFVLYRLPTLGLLSLSLAMEGRTT